MLAWALVEAGVVTVIFAVVQAMPTWALLDALGPERPVRLILVPQIAAFLLMRQCLMLAVRVEAVVVVMARMVLHMLRFVLLLGWLLRLMQCLRFGLAARCYVSPPPGDAAPASVAVCPHA